MKILRFMDTCNKLSVLRIDSKLQVTDLEFPELQVTNLDFPKFQVANLDFPKFQATDLDFPKFQATDLDIPKFQATDLDFPKFQTLTFSHFLPVGARQWWRKRIAPQLHFSISLILKLVQLLVELGLSATSITIARISCTAAVIRLLERNGVRVVISLLLVTVAASVALLRRIVGAAFVVAIVAVCFVRLWQVHALRRMRLVQSTLLARPAMVGDVLCWGGVDLVVVVVTVTFRFDVLLQLHGDFILVRGCGMVLMQSAVPILRLLLFLCPDLFCLLNGLVLLRHSLCADVRLKLSLQLLLLLLLLRLI
ncbi:unnamed protein product [Lampetra fluviatilis]